MALLRRSGKLPDNVGKPKGAAAKSPTPEIDAEPSTYDAATDELIMGLPEKKLTGRQQAFKEDKAEKIAEAKADDTEALDPDTKYPEEMDAEQLKEIDRLQAARKPIDNYVSTTKRGIEARKIPERKRSDQPLDLEGKAFDEDVARVRKIIEGKGNPAYYTEKGKEGIAKQVAKARDVDTDIGNVYGKQKYSQAGLDPEALNVPDPNLKNLEALFSKYAKEGKVSGKEMATSRRLLDAIRSDVGRKSAKMGRGTLDISAESMARQLPQPEKSRELLDRLTASINPKAKAQAQSVADSQAAKQASLRQQRTGQPIDKTPIARDNINDVRQIYKDTVQQLEGSPDLKKRFVDAVRKLVNLGVDPEFAVKRARASLNKAPTSSGGSDSISTITQGKSVEPSYSSEPMEDKALNLLFKGNR